MSISRGILQKLNSFTKREQALLFGTGVVMIFLVMQYSLLEPLQSKRKDIGVQIDLQTTQNKKLNAELNKLKVLHQGEYEQLIKTSKRLDQRIIEIRNAPESFRTLGEWLSIMLAPFAGLDIISLESEPHNKQAKEALHEHISTYHLHLRGRFSSLLAFLSQLEKVPNVLSFDDFKFEVKRFPDADIYITLSFLNSQAMLNQLGLE